MAKNKKKKSNTNKKIEKNTNIKANTSSKKEDLVKVNKNNTKNKNTNSNSAKKNNQNTKTKANPNKKKNNYKKNNTNKNKQKQVKKIEPKKNKVLEPEIIVVKPKEEIELNESDNIKEELLITKEVTTEEIKEIVSEVKKEEKKERKKSNKYAYIFIVLLILIIFLLGFYYLFPVSVKKITFEDGLNSDDTKTMIIKLKNANLFKTECSLEPNVWVKAVGDECHINTKAGTYNIKVRNLKRVTEKEMTFSIDEIKGFSLNLEKYYLAIGESKRINTNIDSIGNPDKTVEWSTTDSDIASVNEGKVTGVSVGEVTITATLSNGEKRSATIIVTDLIRKPELDMNKKAVPCKYYSEEDAETLDNILFNRVEVAGSGSRAATIEVIRFITLNFRFKVPYYFENGRLDNFNGQKHVDGEGRYHHLGLYLSESKYQEIGDRFMGPQMWGCGLPNFDDSYGWVIGQKYPNGLDCSGFVTWALYNGGTDVGDIGAGITPDVPDMSDVGEMHELTYEYANAREYKVGDVIARDEHTALIAGIDDENIYIAESLLYGVRIVTYSYKNPNSQLYRLYGYINTLDDVYTSEGEYTDMWE